MRVRNCPRNALRTRVESLPPRYHRVNKQFRALVPIGEMETTLPTPGPALRNKLSKPWSAPPG